MPETIDQAAMVRREGGCMCGAVRYTVVGAPQRVGLCHCDECPKFGG